MSPFPRLLPLLFLSFTCSAGAQGIPVLHLDSEVTAGSVEALQAELIAASLLHPRAIVLEINSPGGDIEAGFRLAKSIEDSATPVVCVVDKTAASMASYILESCQVRLMTRRSMLMFHEPALGSDFNGQQTKWRSIADWLTAETIALAEHVCGHSKMTTAAFLDKIRGGAMWWVNWKEALALGFVDGVVGSTQDVVLLIASKG